MTAVAASLPARTPRARHLAGTGALLRLALRRDRVLIPAWVLALGVSVAAMGSSFEALYDTVAQRVELVGSMNSNGSMRALYGPVFGDSIGGLIAWRMAGLGAVLAAVMSLLIVVRHTREEEETGRQEMLSAAMVGRRAPLTAALLTALLANAVLAVLIAGGLAKSGRPTRRFAGPGPRHRLHRHALRRPGRDRRPAHRERPDGQGADRRGPRPRLRAARRR